ncbi:MAG TPA: hypothetical protein VGF40_13480 [Thermoanaerobaculia bacterium]
MGKKFGIMILAILMVASLGACRVEKTEEGELPEVEVKGGEMPKYDVDTADVDVTTSTATVTTPDVDVSTETAKVTVPDVDVTMPQEKKPPQQQ